MIRSETGNLYGLVCSDLTDAQLNKVITSKLIECLPIDSRIQGILAGRMSKDLDGKEVGGYKYLDKECWKNYTLLCQAYNDLLKTTNSFENELATGGNYYYYYRNDFVFWPALNDEFKLKEVQLFLDSKSSVVDRNNIDYEWLNLTYPELSKQVVRFIMNVGYSYHNSDGIKHVLIGASQDMLLEFEPNIKALNKESRLKLLSNPNTPEAWLDELLRFYAKKVKYHVPEVNRALSSALLSGLPPITRLEVMERLMYKTDIDQLHKILPDVKTPEDFRALLFGALTRHSDRVISLVKAYNAKVGKEQGNEDE